MPKAGKPSGEAGIVPFHPLFQSKKTQRVS